MTATSTSAGTIRLTNKDDGNQEQKATVKSHQQQLQQINKQNISSKTALNAEVALIWNHSV